MHEIDKKWYPQELSDYLAVRPCEFCKEPSKVLLTFDGGGHDPFAVCRDHKSMLLGAP